MTSPPTTLWSHPLYPRDPDSVLTLPLVHFLVDVRPQLFDMRSEWLVLLRAMWNLLSTLAPVNTSVCSNLFLVMETLIIIFQSG